MATLLLTSAASAFAASAELGFIATTALGVGAAVIGGVVDQKLFGGGSGRAVEGPRLDELRVQTSMEGAPIPRIYGRARVAGQIIWAAKFTEVATTTSQSTGGGGKGLGGGGSSTTSVTEYSYFARFAVGLCEGEITRIGRVWADGKPLNLAGLNYRVYRGTETQLADPLIAAIEGTGNAAGFRGTAYVLFEDLPLADFGNRVPQLTFEVFRGLSDVERLIRAVDMIPGSTEFGYDPQVQIKDLGDGRSGPENQNNTSGSSDWDLALDQLTESCENCESVALVVAWFGNDLRAGQCAIRPGVEIADKITAPDSWLVDGVGRGAAYVISQSNGFPAYGGTPSDAGVVRAIQDLKARGLRVMFYPFIMMDIPAGNILPDPYSGTAGQPEYPWRGRITCDPAPGESGSPDKTAAADAQIDAFFGNAAPDEFAVSGTVVSYTGAPEWGLRRMILHYAHLCAAAGGVDAFLIGSELRALTTVRNGASSYPAVDRLVALAADVNGLLPAAKISYAADWSEYFGHQPADGTGDVHFHLDPLWADANIDFVGIDNYMPLSDWRDGESHLDAQAANTIYELSYLRGNIRAGEGYDWFYASESDRQQQMRTPITDGAYGKPWVFRYKDLWSWWGQQHFDRPGGVEAATPTAWAPESKPIWFTEAGCPAVDKGTNQPNKFIDTKSSESSVPHFSDGTPDDLIQRRYMQATCQFWDPANPEYQTGNNPTSSVYGAPMIDPANVHIWTWDARPWPDFPARSTLWADAGNWRLGHWINGRLGAVPLRELVEAVLADNGFSDFDASGLVGVVDGMLIDRIMSAREVLQPLAQAYFFDPVESDGVIRFVHRGGQAALSVTTNELVEGNDGAGSDFALSRGQETELPLSIKLLYIDGDADYRRGGVESRKLTGRSARVGSISLPIVMGQSDAQRMTDSLLQEAWAGRERAQFALPPSRLALDPGDMLELTVNGRPHMLRIESAGDAGSRAIEAMRTDTGIYRFLTGPERAVTLPATPAIGTPVVEFLDIPLLTGLEASHAPRLAAFADPWPGAVAVYKSPSTSGYVLDNLIGAQATMGRTDTDVFSGPTGRWDNGTTLFVTLFGGTLESRDDLAVLGGANAAAIRNANGDWEILQFANAELVGANQYKLTRLLRGQAGTERAMADPVTAGARFVLFDGAIAESGLSSEQRGLPLNWRYGPSNRSIDDFTYQTVNLTGWGIGLRPYSPAHIVGIRNSTSDDLTIRWVRRTRIGGDSWEQAEVPLGEDIEHYEVDILDSGQVVRTLQSSTSSVLYTAAQQTADFGSAPAVPLDIAVYQLSTSFGRGSAREVTLNV